MVQLVFYVSAENNYLVIGIQKLPEPDVSMGMEVGVLGVLQHHLLSAKRKRKKDRKVLKCFK